MKTELRPLLTRNALARKCGVSAVTAGRRLQDAGINPDAIAINGERNPILLYDPVRLPTLREAIINSNPKTVI